MRSGHVGVRHFVRRSLAMAWFVFLTAPMTGCGQPKPVPDPLETVFYPNSFADAKEWTKGVEGDIATASQGYVGLSVKGDGAYKVQVSCGDEKYNYDIANDGTATYFPLSLGDGSYRIRVLKNTSGSKYVEMTARTVEVRLDDEFQPFLHANAIVSFTADSVCVAQAGRLAAASSDEDAFMNNVMDYICSTVSYDSQLAATVTAGYVPDPDRTISRGKGICYDYASLAAAMLRSQGIPCKLITGFVDDYYHAWNAIYLKGQGWVVTEFDVKADTWSRVDFTLADSGTFGLKDKVYTDAYVY